MGDMNKLFASGQMGGGAAPNSEKPAVAITAPFLGLLGINGADTKGLIPDSQGASGIFKDVAEGGRPVLSLSSKPMGQPKNWMEKIIAAAANELGIGKIKTDNSGGGGGGGGASSGGGGSTSTANAPVSSGGGSSASSGGGGGGSGGSSYRGGSSDGSLETAVASARGVVDLAAMNANLIGPAVQVHMDHTPSAPQATPAVAVAADDGHSRFG